MSVSDIREETDPPPCPKVSRHKRQGYQPRHPAEFPSLSVMTASNLSSTLVFVRACQGYQVQFPRGTFAHTQNNRCWLDLQVVLPQVSFGFFFSFATLADAKCDQTARNHLPLLWFFSSIRSTRPHENSQCVLVLQQSLDLKLAIMRPAPSFTWRLFHGAVGPVSGVRARVPATLAALQDPCLHTRHIVLFQDCASAANFSCHSEMAQLKEADIPQCIVTCEELFQGETEHFKPEAAELGADHRPLQSQGATAILTLQSISTGG